MMETETITGPMPYTPLHKCDPLTIQLYTKARAMHAEGKGQADIAKALNLNHAEVGRMAGGRWKGKLKSGGAFVPPKDVYPVVKKMYEDAKALVDEGKTFRQVAAKLGVSAQFIYNLAHGKYNPKNISFRILSQHQTSNGNEANAEVIASICQLLAMGHSVKHVSSVLQVRPAVIRAIENGTYNRQPVAGRFPFDAANHYVCPPDVGVHVVELYRAARALAKEGLSLRDIALTLGININTVSNMKRGKYALKKEAKEPRGYKQAQTSDFEVMLGGSGKFGCFTYNEFDAVCECGTKFNLKPFHLKYERKCWHIDKMKQIKSLEKASRRMGEGV